MCFHLGEYQRSLDTLNTAQELQGSAKLPDNHSEVCVHALASSLDHTQLSMLHVEKQEGLVHVAT